MRALDLPPIWLLAALAFVWLETRLVPGLAGFALLEGLGNALCLVAIALFFAAGLAFLRHRTTIIPHQAPSALITSGIFAVSRNPIYLADVILLVGLSLRWGAISGLVLAPVLVWVLRLRFIEAEEARLRAGFGAEADAYFARTARWFGQRTRQ